MMIAAVAAAAAFTISGVAFVMGKLPFKFQLSNDPLGYKCRLRYYSARRVGNNDMMILMTRLTMLSEGAFTQYMHYMKLYAMTDVPC